jgi:hypothetical protein
MMRQMRYVLWLLLLIGAPSVCLADEATVDRVKALVLNDGQFYTVRIGGYVIKSNVDEQFTAEAAIYMYRFSRAFRRLFKPAPKLKTTPIVHLFKDRSSFQAYVRERFKDDKLALAGGFYMGGAGRSELFCWHARPGKGFAAFPKETLQHEGAHQLLSYILGTHKIPIWFNEGVATFFEGWNVAESFEENIARLNRTHQRFSTIQRTYGTPAFNDLTHLVQLTPKTWIPDNFGDKTKLHYAQAESFMTFLMISGNGRRFFAEIFNAVAQGRDVRRMLNRKTLDSAQRAWYADIERRIAEAQRADQAPKD